MQRQSNKVGPRLDEDLKHDSEAIVRGGHASRAEEWKGSEPAAEDQPAVRLRPELAEAKVSLDGSGEGMSAAEIELRSELATYTSPGRRTRWAARTCSPFWRRTTRRTASWRWSSVSPPTRRSSTCRTSGSAWGSRAKSDRRAL